MAAQADIMPVCTAYLAALILKVRVGNSVSARSLRELSINLSVLQWGREDKHDAERTRLHA